MEGKAVMKRVPRKKTPPNAALRIPRALCVVIVGLCMLLSGAQESAAQLFGGNAYMYRQTIWATRLIPVCWETPGYDADKELVRRAVEGTWERESALDFIGWQSCTGSPVGIRIAIADVGPHTKGLGSMLNGLEQGMVLNFTFSNWPCGLNRNLCITAIAVHEFGHALAFAHEQNRPDTPAWCREAPQGTNGDVIIGDWDEHSVMNYCNPTYSNYGHLSSVDVQALRAHYGEPVYSASGDGEALLAAAWAGNLDGVRRYLTPSTFGARSPEGLNALMMAADRCYLNIAQFILNSGMLTTTDVNTRNTHRNTALEIALGTPRELREQGITRPRCPAMAPMLQAFGGM